MRNQPYYDNNANNIEYFDLHKPKIEIKKKREDIREFSDEQLLEKFEELEIQMESLSEMYRATNAQSTLDVISRLTSFKTVLRIEMRKRKINTQNTESKKVSELNQKIKELGLQIELLCKQAHENNQAEKTKRHEMNIKNSKYQLEYCKAYLKQVLSENEYNELVEALIGM